VAAGTSSEGGAPAEAGACAALPAAKGKVVEVFATDADEIPRIVREAPAGTTILFNDGVYAMKGTGESERRIQVMADGLTLRSKSGNRDGVLIDGAYATEEIITINASHVTIADLSIARAVNHPVHVLGGPQANSVGTLLYNLHISDGGEQFVKVNTSGATPNTYADEGALACSLLEMTDSGRTHVVPEPGGCYTGGIDGHQARGWVVRDNRFSGIYCTNGSLAEHAIHFWTSSRETLVENNTIVDCARGIGFGLGDGGGNPPDRDYADDPYPGVGYVGHYGGVIRNNVIGASVGFRYFDTGIELEQARGTRVLHNTIVHGMSAFASISHRWPNTLVTLENNLVETVRARDGSQADGSSSLQNVSETLFVDVAGGDFHLRASASAAIDHGIVLDDAGRDIDGASHEKGAPDLGADEFGAP
jgi:hypothetical protein